MDVKRDEKMHYTVYLNFRERIMEMILPSSENGEFRADVSSVAGRENCFVTFESRDGIWRIKNDRDILVNGSGVIEDGKCSGIEIRGTVVTGAVFASELNENTAGFEKYYLQNSVRIGNAKDSDIILSGEYISRKHAVIECTPDGCVIKNLSDNGIWINGRAVRDEKALDMFDTVWISGAKLVYAGSFVAVQKNSYFVSSSLGRADISFSDSARRHTEKKLLPVNECPAGDDSFRVTVPSYVPEYSKNTGSGVSDVLRTTVPAAAVLSAAAAFGGALSLPAVAALFAGSTAAISGSWISLKKLSERSAGKKERINMERFLTEYGALLEDNHKKYREEMNRRYPDARSAVQMFRENRQRITGRNDSDFLKIRLCTGRADMSGFVTADAGSAPEIKSLAEKYRYAEDIPVTVSLKNEKLINVSGSEKLIYDFIRGAAVKTAAFHSDTDVRMVLLTTPAGYEELGFIRWFPHVYSDDRRRRYCSGTPEISLKTADELSDLMALRISGGTDNFPHYVVFCTDENTLQRSRLKKFINSPDNPGITFVLCRVSAEDGLTLSGIGKIQSPDTVSADSAASYAESMAAVSFGGTLPVPSSLGFLEMYRETGECTDIAENYRTSSASEGISALLGLGADRKPFYLDIHESGHGPHGLIAGTTGSGKSEVIQTIVLSLALKYSPEEVSFVLIDYKGGGMAGLFENLPHTAGILTNLSEDAALTGRTLVSLGSEIKRRQEIFRENGVSHIDSYSELYRRGKVSEPLPHTVIICDEFAELKREKPEFISQLVSISRVGRSLGVHLILATQKPSGVVDDEIRSNAGFRICLKVRDREDSTGVIGCPDAAGITVTGRALVRTGNSGVCEAVQTGYSGAAVGSDENEYTAAMIRCDGSPAVPDSEDRKTDDTTELGMLTEKIRSFCSENSIRSARRIWCDPLPRQITYDELGKYTDTKTKTGLCAAAGLADDPENQKIYPAVFDFCRTGNILLAGNSGSGKTAFLTTVLTSLALNFPSDDVRISVADFSGGPYTAFKNLPHCETVLTSPDEREMKTFLEGISAETENRKRVFSELHVSDFNEYRETENALALKIAVIDGYGIFREMYPACEDLFNRLSGESAKYGICFAVTVRQAADMKIRTRQNFRTVLAFALNDRSEYTELLGIRPQSELSPYAGRGWLVSGRRLLEFQTAECCSGTGREKYAKLQELFSGITSPEKAPAYFCSFYTGKPDISGGRAYAWSSGEMQPGAYDSVFTGESGALSLLSLLKDEFTRRNMSAKISGKYEGENITVVFPDLKEFLDCIYRSGCEDMACITEKFLSGGKGFGIRFTACGEPADDSREAYRLFVKNSMEGVNA